MSEQRKVPKLRFPEFTDDWEQHKLNEITSRVQGNNGRLNLQTLTISAGNGWMKQEDRFSANIAGKEQKNYTLLKQGELAYNHGNSKLAKYGAVFELKDFDEALVPRVYHSFRVNNKTNSSFIEYLFATKILDKELGKLVSSGARMDGLLNIGYEDFVSIKITVPSFEEQQKIASYFRKVDEIITLHQRKCEVLKKLKKGLLQKMFPKDGTNIPEIRFPEFSDAWEQRKCGDVMSESRISGHSGDIAKKITVKLWGKGVFKKSDVGSSNTQYFIRKEGQFIYSKLDFLNSAFGVIPKELDSYETTTDLPAFDCNGINPYFMFYRAIQPNFYYENGVIADGSRKAKRIHADVFLNMPLKLPTIEEQNKIVSFLLQLDNLITLHQRKLEVLKKLKKGLLQQMFV